MQGKLLQRFYLSDNVCQSLKPEVLSIKSKMESWTLTLHKHGITLLKHDRFAQAQHKPIVMYKSCLGIHTYNMGYWKHTVTQSAKRHSDGFWNFSLYWHWVCANVYVTPVSLLNLKHPKTVEPIEVQKLDIHLLFLWCAMGRTLNANNFFLSSVLFVRGVLLSEHDSDNAVHLPLCCCCKPVLPRESV